jgi:hypothetical protein
MSVGVWQRLTVSVQELARHAEVNQENATTLEPNNQILASPIECLYPLSLELGSDSGGIEGPRQARVQNGDLFEPSPDDERLKADADCLDLG